MVTMSPPRRHVAIAVFFCLSCAGLILFVWLQLGGTVPFAPEGYRLHIRFSEASQLYPNAQVRISGINVGRVVEVQRSGLYSEATLELDPPFAPVHRDARAVLREKTLLGEMYVAMTPGSRGAPVIPDGGTLAQGQVMPIQPLDEVLNSFDARTRANFRALLFGVSDTLAGSGAEDLNSALAGAGPAAQDLTGLVTTLDGQSASLQGVIRDTGTVLAAVSRRQSDLQDVVTAGDSLLATTAAHDRGLTGTVQALPPFLSELRQTLAAADHTAAVAGPTLSALEPVAPLVRPALSELLDVTGQLRTFLRALGPFLGVATHTLPAAQQLLAAALPFAQRLYPAARQVVPVINYTSAYRRELTAAMANLGAALQATAPSDLGVPLHYLRTLVVINNESPVGARQRLPTNRHNAYYAPGALNLVGHGGLETSDCRNLANPPGFSLLSGGPPPCRVAPPWLFAAQRALFHRIEPTPPAG